MHKAMYVDHLAKSFEQLCGSFPGPYAQVDHSLAVVQFDTFHPFHRQYSPGGALQRTNASLAGFLCNQCCTKGLSHVTSGKIIQDT